MAAKKASKVNRIISIDSELDRKLKKASDINWSAVASEAFQQKLLSIQMSKKMHKAIERLRKEQESTLGAEYHKGHKLGREWASGMATKRQLLRLERRIDEIGGPENLFLGDPRAPYSHAGYLAFVINGIGEDDWSHEDATEFWEAAVGERDVHTEDAEQLLTGFVDGALEFWSEAEPHI